MFTQLHAVLRYIWRVFRIKTISTGMKQAYRKPECEYIKTNVNRNKLPQSLS